MGVFTLVLWRRHSRLRQGPGGLEIVLKEKNGPGSRGGGRQGGGRQLRGAWKGLKKPILAFKMTSWHVMCSSL